MDSDGGEQRALEQLRRERGLAWVITPASNLAEARTRLAAEAFDVIVTELRLPDGDAFDLFPDRAALGDRAALLVTGHGGEAAAARALHTGFSDYLVKRPATPTSRSCPPASRPPCKRGGPSAGCGTPPRNSATCSTARRRSSRASIRAAASST